jgi:hypothetical protein
MGNGGYLLAIFYKKIILRSITQITDNSGNLATEYNYYEWESLLTVSNWLPKIQYYLFHLYISIIKYDNGVAYLPYPNGYS